MGSVLGARILVDTWGYLLIFFGEVNFLRFIGRKLRVKSKNQAYYLERNLKIRRNI